MTRDSLHKRSLGRFHVMGTPLGMAEVHQRLKPIRTLADAVAERLDARRMISAQQAEVTQPEPRIHAFGFILHHSFHALLSVFRVAEFFVKMAEIPQRPNVGGS